jgi:hypothetical protein
MMHGLTNLKISNSCYLNVEIFRIVRSEHMAAEGDTVPETSTNQIVDSLPVPVPPKKKKMKGWEECEMLEVLLAFQVRVLKRTGVSGSNPEQDKFLLAVNNVTRENGRSVWMPLKQLKALAWTEHPSTVKMVGVLQLGVSGRNLRLLHF